MNKLFKDFLEKSKISPSTQEEFLLSSEVHPMMGECIVIPVVDFEGKFIFNKYRRSPLDTRKPKYLYDTGSKVALYAWHKAKEHKTILITEGEKDTLVAWSHNIPAVTSTGGALSFQKDWAQFFLDKDVIVCLDNDESGGEGMAKILDIIPHAKLLFFPNDTRVKDLSEYCEMGGDIHTFIKSAVFLPTIEAIKEHRATRKAQFQSTYFHDAYVKNHELPVNPKKPRKDISDKILRAKSFPIDEIIEFNRRHRTKCIWHNDSDPSLQYYPNDNHVYCFACGHHGDAIDVYRQLHKCSFNEATNILSK